MAEDFNQLRLKARKLGKIDFKQAWQFRLEIEPVGPEIKTPSDLDFYVKDVSYDPVTIAIDSETIGGHTFNWPKAGEPVTISMTMRDHADNRIYDWFSSLSGYVVSTDGCIRMISEIKMKVIRYAIQPDMSEKEKDTWECFPTKMGPVTENRSESGHLEFPITFTQITDKAPT